MLPPPVKHVALNLATYADGDGRDVFPGNERLCDDTGLSDKTVRRALERLRQVGLIVRVVSGSRGGRRGVADAYRLAIPDDLLERVVLVSQAVRSAVTGTGDPEPNTGHGDRSSDEEHRSDVPGTPVPVSRTPVTRSGNTGHSDRAPVHDHTMYQPMTTPAARLDDVTTDRARANGATP